MYKVQTFLSRRTVETYFWSGICHLLKPAKRFLKSC